MNDEELLHAGYRYALSLSHSEQTAEDLIQDAWIRLFERNKEFTKPLLFTTIRNLFIDQYRRQKLVVFDGGADISNVPENGFPTDIAIQSKVDVEEALKELRIEEREAIVLNVMEGYTAQEISNLTEKPRGTILSLIHRGKHKMLGILTRDTKKEKVSGETR
jgi:RNA polymerase sigma-70 factor, ECF subfamily